MEKQYDNTEISPITKKESVIVELSEEGMESRICMDTGYTTQTKYKIGDDKVISEYESSTSQLIRDLRFEDKQLGQYWYLTTVMFTSGMIYPEGNKDDWKWVYAPIINIPDDEQKEYPVPGKPGEYYETRLGVDVAEYYESTQFADVCKRVGVAKDIEV
jgi:hypothetical protein